MRVVRPGGRRLTQAFFFSFFSQGGGDEAPSGRTTAVAANPSRSTAANPTRSTQQRSTYQPEEEEEEVREKYIPKSRAPAGGRVVVASGPPPTGRVVYVDVNAPKPTVNNTAQPVRVDSQGRLICHRCGEPITTKVTVLH